MTIEAGQQLLHCRLVEKIGEGGMGAVWKAEDTRLKRHVGVWSDNTQSGVIEGRDSAGRQGKGQGQNQRQKTASDRDLFDQF